MLRFQRRGLCRQQITETALALEEKQRRLRQRFDEIEAKRLAVEGRAAAAKAEAESAAAEALNAISLKEENLQAKEALQQLKRKATDVGKKLH